MNFDPKNYLPSDSWFLEYMDCFEETEPPRAYVLFSAMAIVGAVLGRRVWMDYDVHKIRPMLNLVIVGPSGIGKSTSVKMAKALLKGVEDKHRPQFIEGGATKEKLHADLRPNPHAILFAPELATFFSKETYKEGLVPYVTNLLDYEDSIELRTKKDDIITVEFPEVTVIGASTREWLQDMLPDSAVTGGFLARFLLLMELHKYRRLPNRQFHREGLTAARILAEKRLRMQEHFNEMIGLALSKATADPEGVPITYEDYDAVEEFDRWYEGHNPDTGLLSPFAARAGEMILRLSIILAISRGKYEISKIDIASAIKLYSYQAKRLGEIVAPSTPAGKMLMSVMDVIPPQGIPEVGIFQALRRVASVPEIRKCLQSLTDSRDVVLLEGRYRRVD